jgi:hypothetical protein
MYEDVLTGEDALNARTGRLGDCANLSRRLTWSVEPQSTMSSCACYPFKTSIAHGHSR